MEAELDAKAAEKGITIEYKDFNGQNDATTLNQIGTQVVSDGYDAVIPIATLAAQYASFLLTSIFFLRLRRRFFAAMLLHLLSR